jgi:hypothetical protein
VGEKKEKEDGAARGTILVERQPSGTKKISSTCSIYDILYKKLDR